MAEDYSDLMGHADVGLDGATDLRCGGSVAWF